MKRRMEMLPPDVVDYMRRHCPARTDEALQNHFGISYNSWRRIDTGQPIRASLAERIRERIAPELLKA